MPDELCKHGISKWGVCGKCRDEAKREKKSRSVLRREAVQRGEEMPTFVAPSPPSLARLDESCCKECGSGPLLFSCREVGDGLCHRCGHKKHASAEQRLAEVERERDEVQKRCTEWCELASGMISQLREDYYPGDGVTCGGDKALKTVDGRKAIVRLQTQLQSTRTELATLKAENERLRAGREDDGGAEPIDEAWLLKRGAFHNSGEIVLPLVMNGVTNQLRFVHDILKPDWISSWCLFPSTGEGRIWLLASNRPGPEFGRCIFPKAVRKLASALGITLNEKGG